jgi:hypothetical protein
MKKLKNLFSIFFLIFFCNNIFALNLKQISDKEVYKIAEKINKKLYGKYNIPDLPKKNNLTKTEKNSTNIINTQKKQKNYNLIIVNNFNNRETDKINIIEAPYLSFQKVVKKVIGAENDTDSNLCEATIQGKDIIDSCKNMKKFINQRNFLLDEFISNLYKLKKDIRENNIYYNGFFSCGILYKYYYQDHYDDCFKLMNMLSKEEKDQLYKYIDKFLQN